MCRKDRCGSVFLVVVCLVTLSIPVPEGRVASALQAPPPEAWPHPRVDGRSEDVYLPAGEAAPGTATGGGVAAIPAWSRLAFQSGRDGNWEIYLAEANGSNQVRLTSNSKTDMQPSVNRGCTRIAFASNRTGNYDVYTMNPDGSDLTRLTDSDKDDVSPSWSPDGTRIAFEAYGSGGGDVYVMAADGSGKQRLTSRAEWEGEPAWSPDGSQIAFTAYRNSAYRIWRMNADGSDQVQLSDQPYSEHPAWSSTGQIAFDADGNGDGWQELWTMNADGSGESQRYDPPEGETDAWVGSWSADGRSVAFGRITWIYYGGGWYWTTSYLDAWDSQTGSTARLSSQGQDMYPDWQTTDVVPPVSSVAALSSQSPSPIAVSWSGADNGPAGLASFDVQARDGAGGAWTDWLLATANTSGAYAGVGGHVYYFRCRARDNAGNVEAWPADTDAFTTVEALPPTSSVAALPVYLHNGGTISWAGSDRGGSGLATYDVQFRDRAGGGWTDWQVGTAATSAGFTGTAGHEYDFRSRATDWAQNTEAWPPGNGDASTTLYTWGIGGVVRDNTGAPVVGALPSTVPGAVGVIASDLEGRYAAYVAADADTYTCSWSKAGYGSLPGTASDAGPDALLDVVLPPGDDVVTNGGFEENGQPWPGWEAGGTLPIAIATAERHTGSRAAEMGQDCPYPCLTDRVTILDGGWEPDLASDSAGNLHIIYSGGWGIEYSVRPPGGEWAEPQVIAHEGSSPHLVIDPQGAVHVVWVASHTIYYGRREPSGEWTPPEALVTDETDLAPGDLGLDGRGGLHTIYRVRDAIYHLERLPSGEWQAPLRVNEGSGYYGPGLAVGPDDTVHLVWQEVSSGVYYRARRPDGTWTEPVHLFSGFAYGERQRVAVDATGRPHLFWTWDGGYYTTQDAGGGWLPPVGLPKTARGAGLAVDSRGIVYMVSTSGYAGEEGTYFRQKSPDTGWTDPVQLSTNYWAAPAVLVDSFDVLHTVWEDVSALQYQTFAHAAEGRTATLSQALTIPAGMHSPVLSLFYQLRMTQPWGGSGLEVSISDGVTTTLLLSTTAASPWAHAYMPLQPWAGEQVTVTVALRQAAGDPYAKLFLDEVTLGSAYPDVWIDKSGPSFALPGEQVTYVITYGNRAGVRAAGVTVTDLLPAGLPFVSADPPPTTITPSLTWAVGDLPPGSGTATITLVAGPAADTGRVTNTAEIGSASAELETANNQALTEAWIGRQVFLPVVLRED